MRRFRIIPPIIYRYVTAEILWPFLLSLFVFTGILFLARSLKLVDLVINKDVPVGDILLLFSYIIPRFLEIAVPMSLLLAVILAFGRLSSDSEIIVIRATGLSIRSLAYPVLLFAAAAMLFTTIIAFWIRPWANHRLGVGMFEIARRQTTSALVPGAFNNLGQLTIYAERIGQNGNKLENVIISDLRNPELMRIFFAKHGQIVSDEKSRTLNLKLFDGSIQEGAGQDFSMTYFEITSVRLPHRELLEEAPTRGGKKSNEMYIAELNNAIAALRREAPVDEKNQRRNLARFQVELQKRIALPFSCLCIALIALALGIQPSRGGHTWGAAANVAMGISLILFYYVLFALASTLGEQGRAHAAVVWMPNLLFAVLGLYLAEKTGSEQWLAVSEAIGDKLRWLAAKLRIIPAAQ